MAKKTSGRKQVESIIQKIVKPKVLSERELVVKERAKEIIPADPSIPAKAQKDKEAKDYRMVVARILRKEYDMGFASIARYLGISWDAAKHLTEYPLEKRHYVYFDIIRQLIKSRDSQLEIKILERLSDAVDKTDRKDMFKLTGLLKIIRETRPEAKRAPTQVNIQNIIEDSVDHARKMSE